MRAYILLPAPPTSAPPPPPREAVVRTQPASDMVNGQVIFHEIPKGAPKRIVDAVAPPQWTGTGPYVPGATGTGSGDSVISNIIEGAGRGIPLPKPAAPSKPIIVSRMSEGLLIHKVTPEYPSIARIAHQQGTVLLHAIIGRDGTIQQLQAISGPPMLIGAAIQAVQQWRYRPYILNGQPVEVETQITVNFKLGS